MPTSRRAYSFDVSVNEEQRGTIAMLAVRRGMMMDDCVQRIFLKGLEVVCGSSGVGSRNASQKPQAATTEQVAA